MDGINIFYHDTHNFILFQVKCAASSNELHLNCAVPSNYRQCIQGMESVKVHNTHFDIATISGKTCHHIRQYKRLNGRLIIIIIQHPYKNVPIILRKMCCMCSLIPRGLIKSLTRDVRHQGIHRCTLILQ